MKITVEKKPTAQEHRSPATDLPSKSIFPQKPPRRKIKNSSAGLRVKGHSAAPSGKRASRPETPLLRWKFDEGNGRNTSVEDEKSSGEVGRRNRRKVRPVVSARKLGAGLWRLHSPEEKNGGGAKSVGVHYNGGQLGTSPVHGHQLDRVHSTSAKDSIHSPHSVSGPKHGLLYKFAPSFQLSNSAMEGATKWDPIVLKESEEIDRIFNNSKPHKNHSVKSAHLASLEKELEHAKSRINDLETERRSSKKKLEHFLRRLSEERAAWRSREHEKIRAFIDDMKSDLSREKKNRQRLEIVNSKLVNQLTDAKVLAKRYMQEYEKERKAREMIEEVCDELAKEMGEDKAELEALKSESNRFREEVEEERKMLQMAEVWREERVQMKLIDAKVMLEERYSYMKEIISQIESFLSSRGVKPDAAEEMKKAEFLRHIASSIDMQDIREIKYEPTNTDDIFSVFEDANFADKEIQQCNDDEQHSSSSSSPMSHTSKVHTVSPKAINMHIKDNKAQRLSKAYHKDRNREPEEEDDASEWETVSHNEDHGSSYSPEGSDPSVNNNYYRASDVSRTEWDKNGGDETPPVMEISEVNSDQMRQFKKGYSISKLWRSHPNSNHNNGDSYKIVAFEAKSGRISNGRLSNGAIVTTSPDLGLSKGEDLSGNWSSPDIMSNKAMKGCIEWPRSSAAQKSSLKSRLLEARMESQKVQLRQVLKQKI